MNSFAHSAGGAAIRTSPSTEVIDDPAELDAFTRWQLSGFVSQVPVWCWAPAGR